MGFGDLFKTDQEIKLEKLGKARGLFDQSEQSFQDIESSFPDLVTDEDRQVRKEMRLLLDKLQVKFSEPPEQRQISSTGELSNLIGASAGVSVPQEESRLQGVSIGEPPRISDILSRSLGQDDGFGAIGGVDPVDDPGQPLKRGAGSAIEGLGNAVTFFTDIGLKIGLAQNQLIQKGIGSDIDFLSKENLKKAGEISRKAGSPLRELGEDIVNSAREARGKFAESPEGLEFLDPQRAFVMLQEQGPLMATLIATTLANPAAGAALAFGVEGGESLDALNEFEQQSGQEVGEGSKILIPALVGSFNAALEKVGISTILGRIPGLKSKLAQIVLSPTSEGVTEGIQEINQIVGQSIGTGQDIITDDNLNRIKMATYGGAVLGLSGGVSSVAAEKGIGKVEDVKQAVTKRREEKRQADIELKKEALKRTLPKERQEVAGETVAELKKKRIDEKINQRAKEKPKKVEKEAPEKVKLKEKPIVPETEQEIRRLSDNELIKDLKKIGIADEEIIKMNRQQRLFHATGGRLGSADGKQVTEQPVKPAKSKARKLENLSQVSEEIIKGKGFKDNRQFFKKADEVIAGTREKGFYTRDEGYRELNSAINRVNVEKSSSLKGKELIEELTEISNKSPKQVFDKPKDLPVPPQVSALISYAADAKKGDTVFTPSPGDGSLIASSKGQGARVIVSNAQESNIKPLESIKVDEVRVSIPKPIGANSVIVRPSKGIVDIKDAFNNLSQGGRMIALVDKKQGIDNDFWKDKNVLASLELPAKDFAKFGGSKQRIIVIAEKSPRTSIKPVVEKVGNLPDAVAIIDSLGTRKPEIKAVEKKEEAPKKEVKAKKKPDEPLAATIKQDIKLETITKEDFKDKDLQKVITLRQISKNLANAIGYEVGKDVRSGFVRRFRRKARALFFPGTGIIRVNNINDLTDFAHEVGHFLDIQVFKIQDNIKSSKEKDVLEKELIEFTKKVGFSKSSQTLEEGVAEFVDKYITDPSFALENAPKFHELFEGILNQDQSIKNALEEARRLFAAYQKQDPRQIIEGTISRDVKSNSILQSIKKIKDDIFVNIIDGSAPLRRLEKEMLKANPDLKGVDNPLLQTLSLLGSHGKVEQAIQNHPFLRDGDDIRILTDQKPLVGTRKKKGILFDVINKNQTRQFEGYLVSLRNIELHERSDKAKQKLKSGDFKKEEEAFLRREAKLNEASTAPRQESENVRDLYLKDHPEFENTATELYGFQDWALDYYASSGKLGDEQLGKIKEMNRFYVPFKRFFDEFESKGEQPNVSQVLRDTTPQVVKRIKGSEREVLPPLSSILKNTYDLIVAADKNTALKTIVESLQFIDKKNVQEIPKTDIKPVLVLPKNKDEDSEIRYTMTKERPRQGHIVSVWENGDVKYYDIPKNHYDSFFASFEPISKAIRLLSMPSTVLKAGAVKYDPTFAVRNVPRDQMSAIFYSRYGYNPFYFLKGLSARIGKTEVYQKFLASGGDQGFLTIVMEQLDGKMPKMNDQMASRFARYTKSPWKVFADFNAASEIGTRVGSFQNAYAKTGDVFKAAQEAREIAGDYSIKGNAMRNIISLLPFFNPRIQHSKLFVQSSRRGVAKFVAKGITYVTVPAIINWLLNHRDDEIEKAYNELHDGRKAAFWNVHIPGTLTFFPIMKGPIGILFGSTVESFLTWMSREDKGYIDEVSKSFFKDLSPVSDVTGIIPFFARPLVEQAFDRVAYTGRPVVGKKLEKLAPTEQFTSRTSEVAKSFGRLTGLSPVRIQHIVTAYTAGSGRGALYMADEVLGAMGILPKKPDDAFTRLGRVPLIRGFITETPLGPRSRSVQKFYEVLDKMEEVNSTVNNFAVEGQFEQIEKFLKRGENQRLYDYYSNPNDGRSTANRRTIGFFREILTMARAFRNEMRGDSDFRDKVFALDKAITDIAIRFNDAYSKNEVFEINEMMETLLEKARERKAKRREKKAKLKEAG